MSEFSQKLHAAETRAHVDREQTQFQDLPKQIAHAQKLSPAFAEILRDVNAARQDKKQRHLRKAT